MCSAGSTHLGFYTTSVPDAIFGYPSSGYLDDLAWGAAWLYKATGNATYLTQSQAWFSAAQTNTSQSPMTPLAWNYDNQLPGTALLLANFSGWQNQTIVAEVCPFPHPPVSALPHPNAPCRTDLLALSSWRSPLAESTDTGCGVAWASGALPWLRGLAPVPQQPAFFDCKAAIE